MTDYMSTPAETAKQPHALAFIEKMANGDVAVFNAMWSFWNFAHAFDDLVDNAKLPPERREQVVKALHDFVVDLLVNPFMRQHALEMRAMFVSAMMRMLDGDRMVGDQAKLAPAVKCADIDVLLHMGYLHRGWTAMRELEGFREYDIED